MNIDIPLLRDVFDHLALLFECASKFLTFLKTNALRMGERRAAKRVQPRVFFRGEHCATGYVFLHFDLAPVGSLKLPPTDTCLYIV